MEAPPPCSGSIPSRKTHEPTTAFFLARVIYCSKGRFILRMLWSSSSCKRAPVLSHVPLCVGPSPHPRQRLPGRHFHAPYLVLPHHVLAVQPLRVLNHVCFSSASNLQLICRHLLFFFTVESETLMFSCFGSLNYQRSKF